MSIGPRAAPKVEAMPATGRLSSSAPALRQKRQACATIDDSNASLPMPQRGFPHFCIAAASHLDNGDPPQLGAPR
jgi:hypothetical protein